MIKLAVIGNPVFHSLSPLIHRSFAQEFNMNVTYQKILSPKDNFEKIVYSLVAQGYVGINVTAPFKESAFILADTVSERAKNAQSVNTLTFKDDVILGDNTDGVGLLKDICVHKCLKIKHQRILVLGAGGAAKGVVSTLLEHHPNHLHIANRTPGKCEIILDKNKSLFGDLKITSSSLDHIPNIDFDLVIDTTTSYDAVRFAFKHSPVKWKR